MYACQPSAFFIWKELKNVNKADILTVPINMSLILLSEVNLPRLITSVVVELISKWISLQLGIRLSEVSNLSPITHMDETLKGIGNPVN